MGPKQNKLLREIATTNATKIALSQTGQCSLLIKG